MKKGMKALSLLIVLLLLCGGCVSEDVYPSDARGVVNAFLRALCDGDVEEILKYCEENTEEYEKWELSTDKNLAHELAVELVRDPEKQKQIEDNEYIQEWAHVFFESVYKDFQIIEYEEKEQDASYIISISCFDEDSQLFNYIVPSVFEEYFNNNQEELEKLYENEGEDAVMVKFVNDEGKELLDDFVDRIKNKARYSNHEFRINLKKEDNLWKVIKMERR